MLKIAFRVDGGNEMGLGHVMRCISLAKAFENAGCSVFFISKKKEGIEKLRAEGFSVIELNCLYEPSDKNYFYGRPEELDFELGQIHDLLADSIVDCLIIDSYNVTPEYFINFKKYAHKVAYIDDVNKFRYPVDILINGNITGEFYKYEKYNEDELMLLGLEYNLIRDEFGNLPVRPVKESVEHVLLTTGGADPFGISIGLLKWAMENDTLRKWKWHVVVGSSYKSDIKKNLASMSNKFANIVLHENVQNISELMTNSDIAISSGGSTLYELCACGTPSLSIILADNQENICVKMRELDYIDTLGWHNLLTSSTFINKVKGLADDYCIRKYKSKKMRSLVDAKGAKRVVKKIILLFLEQV